MLGYKQSESPLDVVQAFIDTGDQDIGYWEFIDVEGSLHQQPTTTPVTTELYSFVRSE